LSVYSAQKTRKISREVLTNILFEINTRAGNNLFKGLIFLGKLFFVDLAKLLSMIWLVNVLMQVRDESNSARI
jgi:polyhydroxyalkanoate synthesis regulator protein